MAARPDSLPRAPRRWGQFSLRFMLICMLVAGCGFAWVAAKRQQAAEQRAAWQLIMKKGGMTNFGPESARSPWLCWLLGADVAAQGGCCEFAGSKLTDADLAQLSALSNLNRLSLQSNQITDRGVARLSKLSHLRHLSLDDTDITDAGLDSLHTCRSLEWLSLYHTQTTPAGVERLRQAIPHLNVIDTNDNDLPPLATKLQNSP